MMWSSHWRPNLYTFVVVLLLLLVCRVYASSASTRYNKYDSTTSKQKIHKVFGNRNLHHLNHEAKSYYTAAVVEHVAITSNGQPVSKIQAQHIMMSNLDVYEQHVKEASENGVQIIVFPEDGLYGPYFPTRDSILPFLEEIPNVPSSSSSSSSSSAVVVNPCDQQDQFKDRPVLLRASCLAKQYKIVLVLDMGDVQYCSNQTDPKCPSDGRFQYNTQVAFSETGQLLAKYHKTHLYYEPQFDTPSQPELVYFDTWFGVRFGMMICFDIIFGSPAIELAQKYGIRDFVYSEWWVNTPPFLTGTQMQQAWSRTHQVNLLASGSGKNWYNSGSGIYSQGHIMSTFYNPTANGEERLLISRVPIITSSSSSPRQQQQQQLVNNNNNNKVNSNNGGDGSSGYVPPSPPVISVKLFQGRAGSEGNITLKANTVTCSGSYKISANQRDHGETFALIAADGQVFALFPAQACIMLKCPANTTTAAECSSFWNPVLSSATLFDSFSVAIELSAASDGWSDSVYQVLAVDGAQLVTDESAYEITNRDGENNSRFSALSSAAGRVFGLPLLNAAIMGRNNYDSQTQLQEPQQSQQQPQPRV